MNFLIRIERVGFPEDSIFSPVKTADGGFTIATPLRRYFFFFPMARVHAVSTLKLFFARVTRRIFPQRPPVILAAASSSSGAPRATPI